MPFEVLEQQIKNLKKYIVKKSFIMQIFEEKNTFFRR